MLDSYIDREEEAFLSGLDIIDFEAQKATPEEDAFWEAEQEMRVAKVNEDALAYIEEFSTAGITEIRSLTADEVVARLDTISNYLMMLQSGLFEEDPSDYNMSKYTMFLKSKLELTRLLTRGVTPDEAYQTVLDTAKATTAHINANPKDNVFLPVSEYRKGELAGLELVRSIFFVLAF